MTMTETKENNMDQIPTPNVQMDGNTFHAHSGEDFPHGVSGFGDTEQDAVEEYESNWRAAHLSDTPLEGAPSVQQVKGLVEQIKGPSIEEVAPQITAIDENTAIIPTEPVEWDPNKPTVLTLIQLCQIMWDPENQPPQFTNEEAWEQFQAIK